MGLTEAIKDEDPLAIIKQVADDLSEQDAGNMEIVEALDVAAKIVAERDQFVAMLMRETQKVLAVVKTPMTVSLSQAFTVHFRNLEIAAERILKWSKPGAWEQPKEGDYE